VKRRSYTAAPSAGFWLIVASWLGLSAFLAWAAEEPRLDRMKRELDQLASNEGATASDWLVVELRREIAHHPKLSAQLTGETGARAVEARQDGFTRSAHFHVAVGPRVPELVLEATAPMRIEIGGGTQVLATDLVPDRSERMALPASWRGQSRLLEAKRSGDARAQVRIRGVEEARAP
jgi:hypothetical protein